jgi:hypothetical protein
MDEVFRKEKNMKENNNFPRYPLLVNETSWGSLEVYGGTGPTQPADGFTCEEDARTFAKEVAVAVLGELYGEEAVRFLLDELERVQGCTRKEAFTKLRESFLDTLTEEEARRLYNNTAW